MQQESLTKVMEKTSTIECPFLREVQRQRVINEWYLQVLTDLLAEIPTDQSNPKPLNEKVSGNESVKD